MGAVDPVTLPAAPVPERTRQLTLVVAVAGAVALVALPLSASGTGTSVLLAALVLLVAAPALWAVGMRPSAYSLDGVTVVVHRPRLPSSRFTVVGEARRGAADPSPRGPGGGPMYREAPRGDQFLDPGRRTYKAYTDLQRAVRVPIRTGTLLISPEDPDEFIRIAEVLR